MDSPLISVIVPIYNVENYLDRCLNSIVAQTYTCLEILLIDDGSPDNCPHMCEEWAKKDHRIRVIHKENQGLGMARNTGIEHSTGEYLCYFDSDDYIAANTIELAYKAMHQTGADYALFGYCKVFQDGRQSVSCVEHSQTVYSGKEITDNLLPWLIQRNRRKEPSSPYTFSAWSGLLKRSILEDNQIRFQSEREIISEDTLYLLEVYSKLSKVVVIPKPLYFYCENAASLTKTYKKERQSKNTVFLQAAREEVMRQQYSQEVWIRLVMLYQGFSLEAMKHIVRMSIPYRQKRALLAHFFGDKTFTATIDKDTLIRSGYCQSVFLICLKYNLQFLCFLMLWLRENYKWR